MIELFGGDLGGGIPSFCFCDDGEEEVGSEEEEFSSSEGLDSDYLDFIEEMQEEDLGVRGRVWRRLSCARLKQSSGVVKEVKLGELSRALHISRPKIVANRVKGNLSSLLEFHSEVEKYVKDLLCQEGSQVASYPLKKRRFVTFCISKFVEDKLQGRTSRPIKKYRRYVVPLWEKSALRVFSIGKKVFAEGAFGEIHLANELIFNKTFAVKILKKENLKNKHALEGFRNEFNILSANRDGPYWNGVSFAPLLWLEERKKFSKKVKMMGFVSNFYDCDLEMLSSQSFDQCSCEQRLFMIFQLFQALQWNRKRGIIHGDWKPSNVLVLWRDWPVAHLADYGGSADLKNHPIKNWKRFENFPFSGPCTPGYYTVGDILMARVYSACESNRDYLNAGYVRDLFAAGLTMLQILLGEEAFGEILSSSSECFSVSSEEVSNSDPYQEIVQKQIQKEKRRIVGLEKAEVSENFSRYNLTQLGYQSKGVKKIKSAFLGMIQEVPGERIALQEAFDLFCFYISKSYPDLTERIQRVIKGEEKLDSLEGESSTS